LVKSLKNNYYLIECSRMILHFIIGRLNLYSFVFSSMQVKAKLNFHGLI
jgi:hypothetical protein